MEGNPTRELVSEMRGHLENILKDAELAAVLLALLRGEYNNVPRLPKSVAFFNGLECGGIRRLRAKW